MNHEPDLSNLRIRIPKSWSLNQNISCQVHQQNRWSQNVHLNVDSGKAGDNEKLWLFYCRTENEKISGSGVIFHQSSTCKNRWTKKWLKWNFVREDNFTKASNEQLERNAVTSLTGKLKAVKNGWRNRMKQPALITVVWH